MTGRILLDQWQKRGPLSEWTEKNPILGPGEIGVEEDTDYFRIGDGVSHFLDLKRFRHEDGTIALIQEYVGDLVISGSWDDLTDKPDTFPPSTHNHDTRYYQKTEADALLDGKAASTHNHDSRYYTETEINALIDGIAFEVGWDDIADKPATFPATAHTHDDRYFTESETTTAITDAVATEATARTAAISAAITGLIGDAPAVLNTLGEIADSLGDNASLEAALTSAIAAKQDADPILTALSAAVSAANKLPYFSGVDTISVADFTSFARTLIAAADAEAARGVLSLGTSATLDTPAAGDASAAQVVKGNDSRLSDARTPTVHTHDDRYYTETEADALLADKSDVGHDHDSRYYTETEADALLATKSGTAHTHDDRYYTETEADALLAAKAPLTQSINAQTASYSLVLADAGKVVTMDVGSANDLTVPLNSTQAFPVGTYIEIIQIGAGQTTIVATGGVTINATPGLKVAARYGVVALRKIATNTWIAFGRLSA